MVKGGGGGGGQNLPADVAQVIDQLERHCLAPDGSLVPKPAFFDLQLVYTLSLSHSCLVAQKILLKFCISFRFLFLKAHVFELILKFE